MAPRIPLKSVKAIQAYRGAEDWARCLMMFRVHIIVANLFQNSINGKQIERLFYRLDTTFFRSVLNFFNQLTGIGILYWFLKQDSFTIGRLLHKQDLKTMIFFLMFYFYSKIKCLHLKSWQVLCSLIRFFTLTSKT